jgi:hypothetical protein
LTLPRSDGGGSAEATRATGFAARRHDDRLTGCCDIVEQRQALRLEPGRRTRFMTMVIVPWSSG